MLGENIKRLREAEGLSQEELAEELNVVRQTVSKWERGLSAPDAELLIKIAEKLDTSVNVLLGDESGAEDGGKIRELTERIEILNAEIDKRNESRRKVFRAFFAVVCLISAIYVIKSAVNGIWFLKAVGDMSRDTAVIGGADRPTKIYVSWMKFKLGGEIIAVITAMISGMGIYKTRKKHM